MITPEEKEAIKAEIMEELNEKLKGTVLREDVSSTLRETRDKWFGYNGKMSEVFETYTAYKIWECVRKITCLVCGETYVRRLAGKEKLANSIAECLCHTIYNARKWYAQPENQGGLET